MPYADKQRRREYQAKWHQENKEKKSAAVKSYRSLKKEKLLTLKNQPCNDCGGSFHPNIMAFHHIDPSTKEGSITKMLHHWQWDKIEAEIEKCILLCSNCHGLRHALTRTTNIPRSPSKAKNTERVRKLKSQPCTDCKKSFHPNVMNFHHLDPNTKKGSIANMLFKYSWKKIEAEIAKCVLLCANCHVMRHVDKRCT